MRNVTVTKPNGDAVDCCLTSGDFLSHHRYYPGYVMHYLCVTDCVFQNLMLADQKIHALQKRTLGVNFISKVILFTLYSRLATCATVRSVNIGCRTASV